MSTNFPNDLDSLSNLGGPFINVAPPADPYRNVDADRANNWVDAIMAVEARIGKLGSLVNTTVDWALLTVTGMGAVPNQGLRIAGTGYSQWPALQSEAGLFLNNSSGHLCFHVAGDPVGTFTDLLSGGGGAGTWDDLYDASASMAIDTAARTLQWTSTIPQAGFELVRNVTFSTQAEPLLRLVESGTDDLAAPKPLFSLNGGSLHIDYANVTNTTDPVISLWRENAGAFLRCQTGIEGSVVADRLYFSSEGALEVATDSTFSCATFVQANSAGPIFIGYNTPNSVLVGFDAYGSLLAVSGTGASSIFSFYNDVAERFVMYPDGQTELTAKTASRPALHVNQADTGEVLTLTNISTPADLLNVSSDGTFAVNTDDLYISGTTGRVAINSTSPSVGYALTVSGLGGCISLIGGNRSINSTGGSMTITAVAPGSPTMLIESVGENRISSTGDLVTLTGQGVTLLGNNHNINVTPGTNGSLVVDASSSTSAVKISSGSATQMYVLTGTASPITSAPRGSLALRSLSSAPYGELYVNTSSTDPGTTWTSVTKSEFTDLNPGIDANSTDGSVFNVNRCGTLYSLWDTVLTVPTGGTSGPNKVCTDGQFIYYKYQSSPGVYTLVCTASDVGGSLWSTNLASDIVALCTDGYAVYTAGTNNNVYAYSCSTGALLSSITPTGATSLTAIHSSGTYIVVGGSYTNTYPNRLWLLNWSSGSLNLYGSILNFNSLVTDDIRAVFCRHDFLLVGMRYTGEDIYLLCALNYVSGTHNVVDVGTFRWQIGFDESFNTANCNGIYSDGREIWFATTATKIGAETYYHSVWQVSTDGIVSPMRSSVTGSTDHALSMCGDGTNLYVDYDTVTQIVNPNTLQNLRTGMSHDSDARYPVCDGIGVVGYDTSSSNIYRKDCEVRYNTFRRIVASTTAPNRYPIQGNVAVPVKW